MNHHSDSGFGPVAYSREEADEGLLFLDFAEEALQDVLHLLWGSTSECLWGSTSECLWGCTSERLEPGILLQNVFEVALQDVLHLLSTRRQCADTSVRHMSVGHTSASHTNIGHSSI